jgi:ribulose 1,5-bisphosphate synthetase/thiazole synthase
MEEGISALCAIAVELIVRLIGASSFEDLIVRRPNEFTAGVQTCATNCPLPRFLTIGPRQIHSKILSA